MTTVHRKPTRRILHTSDLHLSSSGDRGCHSLEAVINLAIKSRADLLLIAGDLFDHNRVNDSLLGFVHEQIWRIPIPVVILPGNHDCLIPNSVYEKNGHWRDCRNVHIIINKHGETLDLHNLNISIWGMPIINYVDDVRPLQNMPQPEQNGFWNIAMAHGFFVDSPQPFARSYTIQESEIRGTSWDYIALGHIPLFRSVCDNPLACYCGSATETGTVAMVDFSEESGARVTRCDINVK